MLFISGFPNHHDFIYGNKTGFLVAILQVQHSFFDLSLTSPRRLDAPPQ